MHPPAPCGVGPLDGCGNYRPRKRFQSTRPVRGGTAGQAGGAIWDSEISIHPPRAGRDFDEGQRYYEYQISIHPPRAGRDVRLPACLINYGNFNPPAPCGAGRAYRLYWAVWQGFQSTRPVRGGTKTSVIRGSSAQFQSTRPMRGGTCDHCSRQRDWEISIHPPHAGRDAASMEKEASDLISIHPPRAGRDKINNTPSLFVINFNPPAPCGAGPA